MRKADICLRLVSTVKRYLRESLNKLSEIRLPKISAKVAAITLTALAVCGAIITVSVIGGSNTPVEAADVCIGSEADAEYNGVGRFSVVTDDNTATGSVNPDGSQVADEGNTEASGRYTVTFAFHSRDSISCSVEGETTVGELADKLGITFSDTDVLNISEDTVISKDTLITTDKVASVTDTVHTVIPFTTTYVDDSTLYVGESKTVQYGQNGESATEYEVTYLNGVEDSRKEIKTYTVKEPVEQIIHTGTKIYVPPVTEPPKTEPPKTDAPVTDAPVTEAPSADAPASGGTFVGGDGKTYTYSSYIDVMATVYYVGGYCANGMPADENVIAVDPRVIPLGTKVYITGDYADVGVRIAADTGGSIKGNKIDICVDPSNPLAGNFGWRSMRVYFID